MTDNDARDSEQLLLAQRLREAREYVGLSQEAVSEKLDIPRPSISAIETGRRKVGSLELRRLAALYKVSVAWLLGQGEPQVENETVRALFRMTTTLSEDDKQQVLRFAEFLKQAGSGRSSAGPHMEGEGEGRQAREKA